MPTAAPKPCRIAGCASLVTDAVPCPLHGRRPTGRGGSHAGWRLKRMWTLKRDMFCVACAAEGRQAFSVEADHVVPVRLGGTDAYENLQGLCLEHHRAKTASEERERRAGGVV